jgi:hypothetical protein
LDEINDLLLEKRLSELLRKDNILKLALTGGQDLDKKLFQSDHNTVTILGWDHVVTQFYKENQEQV